MTETQKVSKKKVKGSETGGKELMFFEKHKNYRKRLNIIEKKEEKKNRDRERYVQKKEEEKKIKKQKK